MEKDNGIIYTIIITALIAGLIGYYSGSEQTKSNVTPELITESQEYQNLKDCADKLKDNLEEANMALMPVDDNYDELVSAINDAQNYTSDIPSECNML